MLNGLANAQRLKTIKTDYLSDSHNYSDVLDFVGGSEKNKQIFWCIFSRLIRFKNA